MARKAQGPSIPRPPQSRGSRHDARSVGPFVILALALLTRATFLYEIRDIGFIKGLLSDANVYNERAIQIAQGDWLGPADFVHAPMYAYFLGLLRSIGMTDLWTPRIIQAMFGAACCLLIADMARRLFDARLGFIAGTLYAVFPPAVFFDGQIQKTSLAAFLAILLLWQLVVATKHLSTIRAALCGLTAGLLILTQQSMLILIPLLIVWLAFISQSAWSLPAAVGIPHSSAIRHSLFFILTFTLTLLPWSLRNRAVTGHFTLTTPNLGQNFFMGNSEKATGTYLPQTRSRGTGEYEQEDWTINAESATGRPLSLAEVSDYYLHLALDFIRHHPGAWLRLLFKKVLMTWNAYETGDTEDYYLYVEHSILLRVLGTFLHFGILAPIAVAGIALTWHQRNRLWPLYAWAVLCTVAVAAFVVFARYRFPLLPIVVVFAAAAFVYGYDEFRNRQGRKLLLPTAIALIAAVAANWPIYLERKTYPQSYVIHSSVLASQGRFNEAVDELNKALRLNPDDLNALITLGSTLIDMGRAEDSLATLQRAESISTDDLEVLVGLVAAHLAEGHFDKAADVARHALKLKPDDFRAKTGLATALARSGQSHQAIELFQEVLRSRPKHVGAYVNLGNTYIVEGRRDDAARCFETALAIRRDHADALNNLAVLEMSFGHPAHAAELFKRLAEVAPYRPGARQWYDAAMKASSSQPTSARAG